LVGGNSLPDIDLKDWSFSHSNLEWKYQLHGAFPRVASSKDRCQIS
jgi:hypothetical protein